MKFISDQGKSMKKVIVNFMFVVTKTWLNTKLYDNKNWFIVIILIYRLSMILDKLYINNICQQTTN